MLDVNLEDLTNLAKKTLASARILHRIALLKKEITKSKELFIWEVLPEGLLGETLPNGIRSAWIFFLKPDTCTPSHLHPNSVQYSAFIEGGGWIRIGGEEKEIQVFDLCGKQAWYIIPKNVPHNVVTLGRANAVLSFHTCPSNELIEVETSSGRSRYYARH